MKNYEPVTDVVARGYSEGERLRWGMEHEELRKHDFAGRVVTSSSVELCPVLPPLAPHVADYDRTVLSVMMARQAETLAANS